MACSAQLTAAIKLAKAKKPAVRRALGLLRRRRREIIFMRGKAAQYRASRHRIAKAAKAGICPAVSWRQRQRRRNVGGENLMRQSAAAVISRMAGVAAALSAAAASSGGESVWRSGCGGSNHGWRIGGNGGWHPHGIGVGAPSIGESGVSSDVGAAGARRGIWQMALREIGGTLMKWRRGWKHPRRSARRMAASSWRLGIGSAVA
jgi:hypothetical protein